MLKIQHFCAPDFWHAEKSAPILGNYRLKMWQDAFPYVGMILAMLRITKECKHKGGTHI
jgi:hypothetical protein